MLNRLFVVFLVGFITACSTTIERETDRDSDRREPASIDMPDRTETSGDGLQGLMDKAAREVDRGDLHAGLATLERALRIAPRDASIYLSMALVYRSLGNGPHAENMARRGLLYCERRRLCKQLESIIE